MAVEFSSKIQKLGSTAALHVLETAVRSLCPCAIRLPSIRVCSLLQLVVFANGEHALVEPFLGRPFLRFFHNDCKLCRLFVSIA